MTAEPEERLVEDTLFLACTRPAMVAGVPMEAMGLNVIVSATIFLAAHSPFYLLIALVLHIVFRATGAASLCSESVFEGGIERKGGSRGPHLLAAHAA